MTSFFFFFSQRWEWPNMLYFVYKVLLTEDQQNPKALEIGPELRQCRQCCLDVTVSRCHMVWSSQLDRCHFKRHQNHLHYGAFFKIKSSCVDVCEMKHKCTFLKEILTKTNWNHFEYKYVVYMLKCLPERSFFFAFKLNGKQ